ncbi:hypothetical protein ANN_02017 [Periplaneta americana]|uniref:Tc1-like transposase DDE domain-containing protein n=1 Tax=Periplaneta americana TaxID=6978 RepID=A0ABQ8TWW2_PERAM|nr:hypothetical protein ANN_02017 [Periplaneta americana]
MASLCEGGNEPPGFLTARSCRTNATGVRVSLWSESSFESRIYIILLNLLEVALRLNPPSPLGRSEKETSRKVGLENNWFLMHDNAPAHRAIIVKNFLARHNITALDHPPYSPDLSPPDYFLFPRLKSHLKGRRFNAEEVIANATRALRRVSQNGFQAWFQELYTRW